jgi:hypothetical protein
VADFEIGVNKRGRFLVSVQPASRGVLQVMVTEVTDRHYYVDLAKDPRFAWFGWTSEMAKFERKLTEDDLTEYNGYADVLFHKIAMPLWKLTSHSVDRLCDLCEKLSKDDKKKDKTAVKREASAPTADPRPERPAQCATCKSDEHLALSNGPGRVVGAFARSIEGVAAPLPSDLAFWWCLECNHRCMTEALEKQLRDAETAYLAASKGG